MKIALASAKIVDRDMEHNLSQMEQYMRKAKAQGAQLVCFGEAFLQGFIALTWRFEEDRHIAAADDGWAISRIKALTVEVGIDVLFGYNELENENIYSSCAVVAKGEILYKYRRISKGWKEYWKTDEHYKEGTEVGLFDYKGKRCAIGLCGDLWDHPERFAIGADLLFWPVYVCWTQEEWENGGKAEYAEQAQKCCPDTLYINSICEGDAFGGAAGFCGGKIRCELPLFCEDMLLVEI